MSLVYLVSIFIANRTLFIAIRRPLEIEYLGVHLRKGQLNLRYPERRRADQRRTHTKHCHAAVASLGGLTNQDVRKTTSELLETSLPPKEEGYVPTLSSR